MDKSLTQRQRELQEDIQSFIDSGSGTVDDLVELLVHSSDVSSNPQLQPLMTNLLSLDHDYEEVSLKLAARGKDIPYLQRRGLDSLLTDSSGDAVEQYLAFAADESTVFHPRTLHDFWMDLAKEYEEVTMWEVNQQRADQIEGLFGKGVEYHLFEDQQTLQVPSKGFAKSLGLLTNLFVVGYDYAIGDPEREGRALHNLIGLLSTRQECLLHLQYDPELEPQRDYLLQRDLWDDNDLLSKLIDKSFEKVNTLFSKRVRIGNQRTQTLYAKLLENVLTALPVKVDLDRQEHFMSNWHWNFRKAGMSVPLSYAACWMALAKERWQREEDATYAVTQAASIIYEMQNQKKQTAADWLLNISVYDLAVQVNTLMQDMGITHYNSTVAAWYQDEFGDDLLSHLGKNLKKYLDHSFFLKGEAVFVPINTSGAKGGGLVVKVGDLAAMQAECTDQTKIYNEMLDLGVFPLKVPFTKPIGVGEAKIKGKEVGVYVMQRSQGHNLNKRFRIMAHTYHSLKDWKQEGAIHQQREERDRLILGSIDSLLTFHLAGSNLLDKREIEAKEFDPLLNLIERFFVKSSEDGWKEKAQHLCEVVRDNDYDAWRSLEKEEYFGSRVPYSNFVFSLLSCYKDFVDECLMQHPMRVLQHGDAHLNNLIEDGTLIDNKEFSVGHPFFDLEHLIIHPRLRYVFRKEKDLFNVEYDYYKKLNGHFEGEFQFPQSKYYRIHAAMCLTGAMLAQGNLYEANWYKGVTLDAIHQSLQEGYPSAAHQKVLLPLLRHFALTMNHSGSSKLLVKDLWYDGETMPQKHKPRKIGIDFDGVIANSNSLKIDYAKKHFGVELHEKDCTKEAAMKRGITQQQYKQMIDDLYGTKQSLKMQLVKDADVVTTDLTNAGHEIYIITSRDEKQTEFAEQFMQDNGVSYTDVVFTSEGSKVDVCDQLGLDLMVDDSYGKLEDLTCKKYLFSTRSNQDIVLQEGERRLDSFWQLYTAVNAL